MLVKLILKVMELKYVTAALLAKKERAEQQRTDLFGEPPVNVFKELRTQHGWTHNELCQKIYISKQALIRLEQGTYTNPLPSVLTWWAEHTCRASNCPSNQSDLFPGQPLGELFIRDAYSDFQQNQRSRYDHVFGTSLVFNDAEYARIHEQRYHPFRVLRERCYFSLTEVARSLCLPQATLEHFEKKYRTQQSVPKELRNALRDIGYPTDDRNYFADQYMQFRSGAKRFRVNGFNVTESPIDFRPGASRETASGLG